MVEEDSLCVHQENSRVFALPIPAGNIRHKKIDAGLK